MDITLKPELAKFIEEEVRTGRYDSLDDAVNAAVAQLQTSRGLAGNGPEGLLAAIDEGLAEADRGEFVEFTADDVIRERRAAWEAKDRKGA